MTDSVVHAIRRIRPAPLQAAVIRTMGLDRRRIVAFEGAQFEVNPASSLGAALVSGAYEPEMTSFLKESLHPGDTFLDIGANEAVFSVIASLRVGSTGSVVAVEPQSRMLPLIQKNLYLNGCCNCRIVQCLLGAHEGEAKIHLAGEINTGSSSVYRITRYPTPTENVRRITLAELFKRSNLTSVALMKIDVEGAEADVISGGSAVLRTRIIRAIMMEYHPRILTANNSSAQSIHEYLVSSGYTLVAGNLTGAAMYRAGGVS